MAIPSTVKDLSSLTSSNSPLGSDLVGSPATVDDFFRSHAAIIREESLWKSWERRGDVPSYVSGTLFTVPTNLTQKYKVGRRIMVYQASTVFGTINSVTYTSATGVYVTMDGGTSLSATMSEVFLGIDPNAVPTNPIALAYLPLAGGTMAGAISMSNNNVIGAKVVTAFQEVDLGNAGAAKSISFSGGQYAKITLNSHTVLTVTNPPGVGFYQLRIVQDGTGGWSASFVGWSSTRWLASTVQPPFNNSAAGETIINAFWNGTNWTLAAQKVGAV